MRARRWKNVGVFEGLRERAGGNWWPQKSERWVAVSIVRTSGEDDGLN